MNPPIRNLITRTITGIISLILLTGALILHPVAFSLLVFLIMIAGMLEYFHLIANGDAYPQKAVTVITGSATFIIAELVAFNVLSPVFLAFIPLQIVFLFTFELFRNKSNGFQNIAISIFPLLYITLPLSAVIFLVCPLITGEGPHWQIAFGFLGILFINDSFAYFTGSLIGKRKFFERISPKKTWEGTLGGILFGMISAYVFSLFFTQLNTWQWLAGALVIMIAGILGDLSESLLKRNLNIKDSGHFFPGHGGVLDRIDSGLFAAPAFLFYLILLNL